MSRSFAKGLKRGLELPDHDGDEAREGTEEALDLRIAKSKVGECHNSVTSNFSARVPGAASGLIT